MTNRDGRVEFERGELEELLESVFAPVHEALSLLAATHILSSPLLPEQKRILLSGIDLRLSCEVCGMDTYRSGESLLLRGGADELEAGPKCAICEVKYGREEPRTMEGTDDVSDLC